MPIKGLKRDERSVPRAGIIRLGYKTRYCLNQQCKHKLAYNEPDTTVCPKCKGEMGKQTTVEAGHFILKDAPGVAEALGTDHPTELKIYFPFDDIDRNFPTYRTLFSASSMLCQGDGQHILHAINQTTGVTTVKDGVCIVPFSERLADNKTVANHAPGDKMPCPALGEPGIYAKCEKCANRGILLVMLQAVPRMAYFQISTGSIVNLQELPQQMLNIQELIYELTGKRKLAGIPFILRRVLRSMSPIKKDRQGNPQGRVRVDKYFLQLEIEPEYMLSLIRAQRRLVDPMAIYALTAGQQPAGVEIVDSPNAITEPPQWEAGYTEEGDFEEVEEIETNEPVQQPQPEPEPPAQPQTNGKKKERPLTPADLYDGLHRRTQDDDGKKATQAQVGLVASKLEEAFAPDKEAKGKRLTVLHYLWNVESAKELTFKQAKVTLDWLLSGESDSGGDHRLHPAAPEEAKRVYTEAMKAAGQLELPTEEAKTIQPVDLYETEAPEQAGMFGGSELDEYFPRPTAYPD